MNKVNLIRRIGAMCLVFVMVLGMIPSTAYQAVENDRELVVNVDTTKTTVGVYEGDSEASLEYAFSDANVIKFNIDSDKTYTLKIAATTSGDGVESVVDSTDDSIDLSAGIQVDSTYIEEIVADNDDVVIANIARTVKLKSEVLKPYTINMDTEKGTVDITKSTEEGSDIGAVILDPVPLEDNKGYTYQLNPYEKYDVKVAVKQGEKLESVLNDITASGREDFEVLNQKLVDNTEEQFQGTVTFYSDTKLKINVTMASDNGQVVVRDKNIVVTDNPDANIVDIISTAGAQEVEVTKGRDYILEVVPNEGYGVSKLTEGTDEKEIENPAATQSFEILSVLENVDVSVEYTPVYDVTINVNNAEVEENSVRFNSNALYNGENLLKVAEGGDIVLEMIPTTDYYVSGIAVTDSTGIEQQIALSDTNLAIDENGYTYKISGVTEDIILDVTFSKIPSVTDYTLQSDPTDEKPDSVFSWKSIINGGTGVDLGVNDVKEIEGVLRYVLSKDETLALSVTGKKIATAQNGVFQGTLSYDDTSKVESVYVKDENADTLEGYITKYTLDKEVQFVEDKTPPTVAIANAGVDIWLAGDAENEKIASDIISITAIEGSGLLETSIVSVVYLTVQPQNESDILSKGTRIEKNNGGYTITVTGEELVAAGETSRTYYVYAINESGYISDVAMKTVKLDADAPNVTTIIAEDTTGFIDKIFTKDKDVTLYVAADDANGVGLRDITLYVNGTAVGTVPVSKFEPYTDGNKYATFNLILEENEDYSIYAVATDIVGNVSGQYSAMKDESDSEFTSNILYFDAVSPTITIDIDETETFAKGEGAGKDNIYYTASGVFTPSFVIKDNVSGLASYTVTINGVEALSKSYPGDDKATRVVEDTIAITDSVYTEKGIGNASSYVITVTVTDAAGNSYNANYTCYVDNTAPEVEKTVNVNGKTITGYDTYHFFSNGVAKFNMPLKYSVADAGLGYISYQLENDDQIYMGDVIKHTNDDNEIVGYTGVFEIKKEYKGEVAVTLVDRVGNSSTIKFNAIVETADTSKATLTLAETPYKSGNANLYAADTKVAVVVEDEFSGISSVTWSVKGDIDTGKDSSGTINVLREKENNGDDEANATWSWSLSDSSWTLEEDAENLVTKVSGEIPVTHNSNNIKIDVTIIDNAGNKKSEERVICIDKTAPKVEIAFSNTEGDTVYNVDRTATITVYDNNFVAGNTSVKITNTDGSVPSVSAWKSNNNVNNLAYSATVTFTADGDYNMEVSTKDAANRASNVAKIEQFTIDKTAPTVSVSYDNTTAINDTYFAATRTATVTIQEHNFNASNVVVEGVATLNGAPAAFPGVTGWASGGDTRSTNLVFNQDALYSYSISVTDAAGNTAQLSENAFTVDTTAPVIEISGVEDMSANNGEVAPVITITDENYDASGVNIELVGSNQGQIQANGSFSDIANGQVFTFANFAEEQDTDDLYTLNVTKTDKAGNMFEDSISFSVNRFGSVYTFSDELAEINGNYVQEPVDVVITETNVDSLDMDSVKVVLTTNGNPRTLERGEDYTISQTGGGGSWSQYEYRIGKEMFQEDGSYSIAIYSVDNAGNVNENINETKEAEVFFGIDTVNPIITAIDLESGKTYEATEHRAVLSITDNLVLGEVIITVNGEPVEYEVNGTDYSFVLSEASKAYSISVSVVDKAGNMAVMTFDDVWVTTSALVRVLNSPVAVAVGAGTVGVAGVGGGAFVFMRRKNIIKVKRK